MLNVSDGETLPLRLATVLLLGGQSRRMGAPKHLLRHPATQQPLYRHHLDLLLQLDHKKGVFPEGIWISARREQLAELDLPPVRLIRPHPFARPRFFLTFYSHRASRS